MFLIKRNVNLGRTLGISFNTKDHRVPHWSISCKFTYVRLSSYNQDAVPLIVI